MVKTYIFLVGAIFFEVAGTMLLPVSQNFTKIIPTVALSFFYLCAFYFLNKV
jgi:small multidrug resistance pump